MNMDFGTKILGLVLNQDKNIKIFNKYILNKSTQEEDYKNLLYNTCFEIKRGTDLKNILEDLKQDKIGFSSRTYYSYQEIQAEKDNFLNNPFEVEEGVNTCQKCGSKKTYSYTKQIRRADEGTTVFCICVICKNKWKMS